MPPSLAPIVFTASLLLASCRSAPPATSLRYIASPTPGWTAEGDERLVAHAFGARLTATLATSAPRLAVTIDNPGAVRLSVRLGPEALRAGASVIGEVQLRSADDRAREGATDFLPYAAMQLIELAPGGRAVFLLDDPLGRPPALGQFLVLAIELGRAGDGTTRMSLPLQITNAPPAGARRGGH